MRSFRGSRRPTVRPVALTGTPGVGKSAVARRLGRRFRVTEVAELARAVGAARGRGRSVVVDVKALARALGRSGRALPVDVVVGHLAHLLPVREAIVLRCHPLELERRLRRARRGTAAERRENFVCEATDVVLGEAVRRGTPVFEIDTTGRSVAEVAREVARRLERGGRTRRGSVDWLSDPKVTEHLLERAA